MPGNHDNRPKVGLSFRQNRWYAQGARFEHWVAFGSGASLLLFFVTNGALYFNLLALFVFAYTLEFFGARYFGRIGSSLLTLLPVLALIAACLTVLGPDGIEAIRIGWNIEGMESDQLARELLLPLFSVGIQEAFIRGFMIEFMRRRGFSWWIPSVFAAFLSALVLFAGGAELSIGGYAACIVVFLSSGILRYWGQSVFGSIVLRIFLFFVLRV